MEDSARYYINICSTMSQDMGANSDNTLTEPIDQSQISRVNVAVIWQQGYYVYNGRSYSISQFHRPSHLWVTIRKALVL